MRKHRVIRQTVLGGGGLTRIAFDIETTGFDNIMVTFDGTSTDAGGTGLIFPTSQKPSATAFTIAAALVVVTIPIAGVAYAAIGVGCDTAFPLPDMLTITAQSNVLGSIGVKVEGDYHESMAPDPTEDYIRNRR